MLCPWVFGQGGVIGGSGRIGGSGVIGVTNPPSLATISGVATGQHPTITLTAAAPAGSFVIIASGNDQGAALTITAADAASNCSGTYTQIEQVRTGALNSELLYCKITTGLANGSTITITNGTFVNASWVVYDVTGTTSTLDQTVSNNTGGANPIVTGTLTPGTSPTVAFCSFNVHGAWSAYGNIIGTAATGLNNTAAQDGDVLVTQWLGLNSTTAGTCTMVPTASDAATWIFITVR